MKLFWRLLDHPLCRIDLEPFWSPFEEEIVVLNFKIALEVEKKIPFSLQQLQQERVQLQAQYCRNPLEPPLEVLEVYNSVA